MTLTELRDRLKTVPISGTFDRTEFDKFVFGGDTLEVEGIHAIVVGLNYRCLGPYQPGQQVELLGLSLSIYPTHGQCESIVVTDPDTLEVAISEAADKARKQCAHTYGREISMDECRTRGIGHYGNCWHVYECGKCGEVFSVDSSD